MPGYFSNGNNLRTADWLAQHEVLLSLETAK